MASPLNDPKLEALLARLHAQSDTQIDATDAYYERRERDGALDPADYNDDETHRFLADKLVALDRDKAEFCYLLCRALRATSTSRPRPRPRDSSSASATGPMLPAGVESKVEQYLKKICRAPAARSQWSACSE